MRWRHLCAGFAFLLATIALCGIAEAAVITVTTPNDENDGFLGGGTGISLREAVLYSAAGHQINLSPILYPLPLGQIGLTHSLVIQAPVGTQGVIDCGGTTRAFVVPASVGLQISFVTIRNGNAGGFSSGGAIQNDGSLNISNCSFLNDSATADGGALVNTGTLVIHQSFFSGNHANYDGAGLRNNNGIAQITNCTFTGGTTGFSGAALRNMVSTPMQGDELHARVEPRQFAAGRSRVP